MNYFIIIYYENNIKAIIFSLKKSNIYIPSNKGNNDATWSL